MQRFHFLSEIPPWGMWLIALGTLLLGYAVGSWFSRKRYEAWRAERVESDRQMFRRELRTEEFNAALALSRKPDEMTVEVVLVDAE